MDLDLDLGMLLSLRHKQYMCKWCPFADFQGCYAHMTVVRQQQPARNNGTLEACLAGLCLCCCAEGASFCQSLRQPCSPVVDRALLSIRIELLSSLDDISQIAAIILLLCLWTNKDYDFTFHSECQPCTFLVRCSGSLPRHPNMASMLHWNRRWALPGDHTW